MSNSEFEIERGVYQTPSNDDDLYDEYDDDEGFGRGPVFAIFAVILLAGFVGVVWFAYQMGVNQGSAAQPPIISASADPFKVEPDDPQGMAAPQQSLTEDRVNGEPMEEVAAVTNSTEQPVAAPREEPATPTATNLRPSSTTGSSGEGLSVPPPSERVQNAGPREDLRGSQTASTRPSTSSGNQQAAATNTRPQTSSSGSNQAATNTRPSTSGSTASQPSSSVAGPPAPTSSTPAATTGNYVVQVASFPERADADAFWARLQSRHGGIVGPYTQDVQSVDLGDRGTWYRLRFGYFESNSSATALCGELRDAGQDCLVASR